MAFATSILLFLHFAVVGYALIAALHTQRDLVRNALIAPSVGVAATILATYLLNRSGLAVAAFARPLAAISLAAAVAYLAWRRPWFPLRRVAPFAAIALCAFALTGWPLIADGFAWLGTVNPDMTNYLLLAQRHHDQAFMQAPDAETWLQYRDWPGYYLAYRVLGIRSGSELLIAWAMATAGRSGLAVYLPLALALHVALIGAAAALIPTPYRLARILAAVLLASSAMLTLGVSLQLIAQVIGLAFLALATGLFLCPFHRHATRPLVRFAVLAAIVMAAFILSYPETLPFLALAFLIYHSLGFRELRPLLRAAAALAGIGLLTIALTLPDVLAMLGFMLAQIEIGVGARLVRIFPYLLVPSGIPAIWGLTHFITPGGRLLSTIVIVGMALSLAAVAASVWLALRRQPAAIVTLVMILLATSLFLGSSAFGMLKIAMFMQPFLLPTVALALCAVLRVGR